MFYLGCDMGSEVLMEFIEDGLGLCDYLVSVEMHGD